MKVQLSTEELQELATNHATRSGRSAADALADVTAILTDASTLVNPVVVPLPPSVSPSDAWRSRMARRNPPTAPSALDKK